MATVPPLTIPIRVTVERSTPTIVEERGKSYGDPRPNHERIAGLWSAYLGVKLSAHDVAWLMVLLKASRSRVDPSNPDNYEDGIGYVSIAAELA